MPPRDRDRLDFVHLELCTNALILNGIGAPLLKRQACAAVLAAARWSRSLLAGARRSRRPAHAPHLPGPALKTRVTFLSCVRVDRRFGHIGLPDHGARAGSALTAESHSGEPPKPFARPSPLAVASSHPSSLPPPLHIPRIQLTLRCGVRRGRGLQHFLRRSWSRRATPSSGGGH